MTLRDKMFSFDGRLRRQDYWLISISLGSAVFVLTELAILIIFGPSLSIFGGGFGAYQARAEDIQPLLVQNLVGLLTLWPALAMSAKRAHDRDKGARLIITLMLMMFVASYGQTYFLMSYPSELASPLGIAGYLVFNVASLVTSIYILVVVGFMDGTQGSNRFGPSPKGLGDAMALTATEPVSQG